MSSFKRKVTGLSSQSGSFSMVLVACVAVLFPSLGFTQGRVPQLGAPQGRVPQLGAPQGRVPQLGVPQGRVPQFGAPQGRVPVNQTGADCSNIEFANQYDQFHCGLFKASELTARSISNLKAGLPETGDSCIENESEESFGVVFAVSGVERCFDQIEFRDSGSGGSNNSVR